MAQSNYKEHKAKSKKAGVGSGKPSHIFESPGDMFESGSIVPMLL